MLRNRCAHGAELMIRDPTLRAVRKAALSEARGALTGISVKRLVGALSSVGTRSHFYALADPERKSNHPSDTQLAEVAGVIHGFVSELHGVERKINALLDS